MNKLKRAIHDHALANFKIVPEKSIINAGFTLGNGDCHFNAVAAARSERADKVWLVWAETEEDGAVHFINSKGSKFFDETWHEREGRYYHYYLIKEVDRSEYGDIYGLLMATKRSLVRLCGTKKDMKKLNQGKLRV